MAQLLPAALLDPDDLEVAEDRSISYGASWWWQFPPCACGRDYPHLEVAGNRVVRTTGVETLRQWIRFALSIERFEHPIYSSDFGVEFKALIERSATREEVETEIIRMIRDALEVDDRVSRVRHISLEVTESASSEVVLDIEVFTFTADVQRVSIVANLEV